MLANGYSRAQTEGALKNLGLPFSPEALEEAKELIHEKLDFYKTQPLISDLTGSPSSSNRRLPGQAAHRGGQGLGTFVAVGIDLDGDKEVLGFWVLRGRENKGFWAEVLQDLISRGVHRVLLSSLSPMTSAASPR
jgi:hypothetical protein